MPTRVNGEILPPERAQVLRQGDLFTLGDRSFRWEYPKGYSPVKRGHSSHKVLTPKNKPPMPKFDSGKKVTPSPGKSLKWALEVVGVDKNIMKGTFNNCIGFL